MIDRLTEKRPAPGRRISIALAVAVHVVLVIFLVYGVRWQSQRPEAVEVELVRAVPASATVPPPPKPEPKVEPAPAPKAEPKAEPPKPDIVVKKEKPKPEPKEEPPPKWNPARQLLEDDLKRLAEQRRIDAQVAAEQQRLDAQKAAQAATARAKAIADYVDSIRLKIRGNILLPADIKENPAAVYEVTQLPSGEVIDFRKLKSSGHAGYDNAIERAIQKSSPLPKPRDPSDFQRTLKLTFCPSESGCN